MSHSTSSIQNPNYPRYDRYKDSGVEWLGEVPEHWEVKPGRTCLSLNKERNTGNAETTVLSLSYGNIVVKPPERLTGLVPESFEGYQIINPGDIVIRPTDLQNDFNSLRVGLARDRGIITSAYLGLKHDEKASSEYLYYLLHAYDLLKVYYGMGTGLRQNLDWRDFKYLPLTLPPKPEQDRIVAFLDRKTAEIDALIAKKQRQIELLDEQKAILINRAVTRGLNPNAKLKPSGIEWIGEIPEHWEVKKIKYLSQIFRGKFTHRPRNDPSLYDGPYPFVQTGDVARAGAEISSYSQTLNEKGLRVSTLVPRGTIAITIAANIGDVAILGFDACFPDSVVGFLPHGDVERLFFFYILKGMKIHFLSLAPKNTQHNLNVERVGGEFITVPPINEQEAIVSWIEEIDSRTRLLVAAVNREIESLQTLRSTLIAHAVTGRIKV
jgi:type I restriction enzyme S subunit